MTTISDFKKLIDNYKIDNNNIDEILNLMDIFFKMKSIFEYDESILNLYLPHIVFTSIASKFDISNIKDNTISSKNNIIQLDIDNKSTQNMLNQIN
jgi:hypothetical protein